MGEVVGGWRVKGWVLFKAVNNSPVIIALGMMMIGGTDELFTKESISY